MTDELICYCFNHTARAIRDEVLETGRSRIMERIIAAKKEGGCRCEDTNPKGR